MDAAADEDAEPLLEDLVRCFSLEETDFFGLGFMIEAIFYAKLFIFCDYF